MKYLIFDAGPLINFSMNGLLPLFKRIKDEFSGKFTISKEVKKEIIDRPQEIKRFQLGALQLKSLLNSGVIEIAKQSDEQKKQLERKKVEFLNIANSTFRAKNNDINLIHNGEAATLTLASILKPSVIVIDERTTRMLCENPSNLKSLLQKKLHTNIKANTKNYSYFQGFKIIRSTELIYIAYKKGLHKLKDPSILGAMLNGVKYKGCSVSEKEIEIINSLSH